jgi:hypothetical protein
MAEGGDDIPRSAWRETLDRVTREHQGDEITIEVIGPDIGDQEEATSLPLNFLDYDPKDNVVIVGVGGASARFPVLLRHIVHRPAEIRLHPSAPAVSQTVLIRDEEGLETLVTLRRRPQLPS